MSLCRKQESNLHYPFGQMDFKSIVSTNSTIAASSLQYQPVLLRTVAAYIPYCRTYTVTCGFNTYCVCKVKALNHNIQNNLHYLILCFHAETVIAHRRRIRRRRQHANYYASGLPSAVLILPLLKQRHLPYASIISPYYIYTHALSIIYTFFTYDIQNHIILYMTPHADTPCQFAPSSLSRWSHVRITSSVLCITLFR